MAEVINGSYSLRLLDSLTKWGDISESEMTEGGIKKCLSEFGYLLMIPISVLETVIRLGILLSAICVICLPLDFQQPVIKFIREQGLKGMVLSFLSALLSFAALFLNLTTTNKITFGTQWLTKTEN